MKQKLLKLLSIFVAFLTAIPIANAANIIYSVNTTPLWARPGAISAANARTMAASNGKVYVLSKADSKIRYIGKDDAFIDAEGNWPGFESGFTAGNFGFAMTNDDAGNIVIKSNADLNAGITQLAIYEVGTLKSKIIDIPAEFQPGDRTDNIRAQGNLLAGKGYMWFIPKGSEKIIRLNLENGAIVNKTEWTHTLGVASTTSFAYMLDNGKIYMHHRKGSPNNAYLLTVPANGGAVTSSETILSGDPGDQLTSEVFTIQGVNFVAYNLGTNAQDARFSIKNLSTGSDLNASPICPFGITASSQTGLDSYSTYFKSVKVDANTVDLYCFTPNHGASVYRVTANVSVNTVTNVNTAYVDASTKKEVKLSWDAPATDVPSKYVIKYSSDGGTTWSSAIETTALSYTFTGLPTGTYTFKVSPYYEQYLTYGAEVTTSNSINVINAVGAPISNLAYTYLKNTETNIGRQDITLTWNAPTGMVNTTLTGYKVYRNGSLLTTLGAEETEYTNTGVKQNYTYKVVPTFDGLTEDASFGLEVTTTEVQAGVLVAPVISETRNYEGYSLVEIFFKMPNYAPYKPLYFNLYRDGKLIQGKLQSYNTLDESLVRASVETTVKYQVEAVYGSAADVYPPIDSVKSDITTLVIAPRDWAKTGYILQEVYNVPIDEISGTIPSDFSKVDYYRQGQFNKAEKKWYIAQRGNATDGVAGVITFDAETKDDVIKGSTQYYNHVVDANVGIAIDDVGTILIKNNNNTTLAASIPTSTSINSHAETGRTEYAIPTWLNDKYDRRITSALLIAKDGTTKEVDLSNVWIGTNGFVNDMYFNLEAAYTNNGVTNYSTDYGQTRGRSDYYYMWGDVLSANGGYLVFSPSWTRTAFKVKIANGAYVSHEVIEFNRYENTGYLLEPNTGTENYGFKLDGRDDVTVQIRSNGYYGVHEWNKAGTTGWHPIFTADSRINNAGGTSIQAFGEVDGTGHHTGELFVITPQSMHSHNVGDFLISRATKENADDYADEGSLMPSTPVAQYIQTDARSNSTATNANGNWFHAEKGTYASAMKDDDECVDIYQYVPGTRFARYRLIPSNQFPPVQPTLDITTAYNDDKTDITHFDGVATWQRPAGFGRSTGSANAKVVSYLFEMHNNKNELVTSAELPELYKTDGTPVDDEYVYDFNYTDTTGNNDIDFGRYSVNVRVKYQTKDGLYHISDPLYAEDIHDYPAEPVQNLATFAFKQANQTVDEWVEKDGKWVVEQKQVDNYRVEINFDKPDCDEPVSYYTVKALVNNKKDMIDITDFHLHKGMEVVNGIEQAILDRDADGKVIPTSVIPGTYDFENSKAPYYHKEGDAFGVAGQSRQNSVLTWHFRVPAGSLSSGVATASNGEEIVITDEPDQWTFIVVAHYAAKNTYIDKDREANAIPGSLIETGVEVVGEDNASSLEIYPIPASTEITIKSAETINSIVIYNEAGAEVMNLDGDNEMVTTVNIESLATGYYFVKVNNQPPVKIIKK